MPNTILIADPSATDRRQVVDALRSQGLFEKVLQAEDGMTAFDLLSNQPVDVIVWDQSLPRMDGSRLLALAQSHEELSHIPVIILLEDKQLEPKVRALSLGASDVVLKPFNPAELVARIRVQLKVKGLQDSLRHSNRQLHDLSKTDGLTGLANRRYLMDFLEREIKRTQRKDEPCSLIMLDIDHFKKINDHYGHHQGDQVLIGLSNLLNKQVRQYDLAARYGGEEFALVLPETPMDRAMQVAERVRLDTAQLRFFDEDPGVHLTLSLGVAAYPLSQIKTVDDLVREADDALYRAKRDGRNRVCAMSASTQPELPLND